MSQSAGYDDFYQLADGADSSTTHVLVYTDIALGNADGDSSIAYRVRNSSSQTITETVQLYVEITYPNGLARKRMVGWEVHTLTPGEDRYVRIAQCGILLNPFDAADAAQTSLTIMICSLSRLRAEQSWLGAFCFEDMKIPPAEGGSPFSER